MGVVDTVDEDDTIGMVNFMLENARQEAGGGDPHGEASAVEGFYFHFRLAGHGPVDIGYAWAAFQLPGGLAFGFANFGLI